MLRREVELSNAQLRCVIRPDLGGSILALQALRPSPIPVLRERVGDQIKHARQAASFALVPFSNRIAQATLHWRGTDHPLIRSEGDEPHAIHGLGWQRIWTVLEQSDVHVLLSLEHRADDGWPFDFDASQFIQLRGSEIHQTLSITNQDAKPTPVGLGWHPYFVKRKNTLITFKATSRWEMGEDKLPTFALPSQGLNQNCLDLFVDHCFEGWDGVLTLQDDTFHICVTSNLNRLVVYTHPELDSVAIEPVSHVNNALNLMKNQHLSAKDLGVTILESGQSISAHMCTAVAWSGAKGI